jgi:hypothetical protein
MAEKTDYSGNSQQAKAAPAEKPAVEKVVSGAVKVKKKPFGQKFRETFLATDAKTAASYVINEVLFPSARDVLYDAINKGIGRLMYGERGRVPGIGGGTFGGVKTPYATPVNRMFGMGGVQTSTVGQRMFQAPGLQPASPDDFVLPTREDAEVIIEAVNDRLQSYGTVSVYELKKMLGLATNHAENKWGWDNLRGAKIDPSPHGWIMVLPQPIVLQ